MTYQAPPKHTLIAQTHFVHLRTKLNTFKITGKIDTQLLNFQSRKRTTRRKDYVAKARFTAPPWGLATSNIN